MKPLYSPAPVQFRAMKEEPEGELLGMITATDVFPKYVRGKQGALFRYPKESWIENKPTVRWIAAPFRPGEQCYLREVWRLIFCGGFAGDGAEESTYEIHYKDGTIREIEWTGKRNTDPYIKYFDMQKGYPGSLPSWNSPALMPKILARRFFVVVSCVPTRVSEVTEEDAIKAGFDSGYYFDQDGSTQNTTSLDNFLFNWHQRHPGKEWAWRIEIREEKNV